MRPQVLLVTLALLAILASLPFSKGSEEEGGANASAWPCCDNCFFCAYSDPPQCQCLDFTTHGCHPACRSCLKYTTTDGRYPEQPVYRCADLLTNFCERRCTPLKSAAA